jgi:hypothetical protein
LAACLLAAHDERLVGVHGKFKARQEELHPKITIKINSRSLRCWVVNLKLNMEASLELFLQLNW